MKNLMYRYFMKNITYRFVNVLQDFVKSYNNRSHRSLGGNAPIIVNQENADKIRLDAYLSGKKNQTRTRSKRMSSSMRLRKQRKRK